MKLIPLTQGLFAKIDDEDFERVSQYNWCAAKLQNYNKYYATNKRKDNHTKYMSRFILGVLDKNILVDHINRDTLDNRKANLRTCTYSQNNSNRTSKAQGLRKGISFHTKKNGDKVYQVTIYAGKIRRYKGGFLNIESAALAYNELAKIHHGEFAQLNTIPNEIKQTA